MSENIKTTKFKKFGKGYNATLTVKPPDDLSDDGVSKEAHQSDITKSQLPQVAAVS